MGVRAWPKAVQSPAHGTASFSTLYYMGLKKRSTQMTATTLSRASNSSVNLNGPVNEFRHLVMSWDDWQDGMDVVVRHLKQKYLTSFVFGDGMSCHSDCLLCSTLFPLGARCPVAAQKGLETVLSTNLCKPLSVLQPLSPFHSSWLHCCTM